MSKLIDKLFIFISCISLYISKFNDLHMVVPIIIVSIASATMSCIDDERIIIGINGLYIISCFNSPMLIFFIPLIYYDVILIKYNWLFFLSFIPFIVYGNSLGYYNYILLSLMLLTYVIKHRTISLINLKKDYYKLQDNTREISIQLEKQNKDLLEKQDYEINLATLKERNRIARDIHDNVGHLLSRSILQVGALLAINKDPITNESLIQIKNTLSEAMDSIRSSVHDLHEESISLKNELQKLVDEFTYCSVNFDYAIDDNIEKTIKYCFITITKEALSNIIKHSNATYVSIKVREHPGFFQLVIQDNGSNIKIKSDNGIGLKNINDRISSLGGNVNITVDKGFRIFISIPKGRITERT